MTNTRQDIAVVVEGEDWDGNSVPRVLRPGYGLALRGQYGRGFDVRGPHVHGCVECGTPVFSAEGEGHVLPMQLHYAAEHGYTPALLP